MHVRQYGCDNRSTRGELTRGSGHGIAERVGRDAVEVRTHFFFVEKRKTIDRSFAFDAPVAEVEVRSTIDRISFVFRTSIVLRISSPAAFRRGGAQLSDLGPFEAPFCPEIGSTG